MAAQPVNQQGFTLLEVMIAMVLTALAIMGIIALYVTETKASGFSRHTTEAAVLAQDKIEFLRTQGPAANVNTTELTLNERGQTGSGIYERDTTETVIAGQYADIVVTIKWNDDGIAHQILMRARRGL
jgi:prepilin-type N-terminal cleavage/methylation domain-containing protein